MKETKANLTDNEMLLMGLATIEECLEHIALHRAALLNLGHPKEDVDGVIEKMAREQFEKYEGYNDFQLMVKIMDAIRDAEGGTEGLMEFLAERGE